MEERCAYFRVLGGFPGGSDGKESASNAVTRVQTLGQEDPMEKEMATFSSILAWRIPWTKEPGRLQSMESQRVGHDWMTITDSLIHWSVWRRPEFNDGAQSKHLDTP